MPHETSGGAHKRRRAIRRYWVGRPRNVANSTCQPAQRSYGCDNDVSAAKNGEAFDGRFCSADGGRMSGAQAQDYPRERSRSSFRSQPACRADITGGIVADIFSRHPGQNTPSCPVISAPTRWRWRSTLVWVMIRSGIRANGANVASG
jgi:hypothetical protein